MMGTSSHHQDLPEETFPPKLQNSKEDDKQHICFLGHMERYQH